MSDDELRQKYENLGSLVLAMQRQVFELISVVGALQRIVERAGVSPQEFAELVRQEREGTASRRNDALNAEADSRLKDALAKIESPEN